MARKGLFGTKIPRIGETLKIEGDKFVDAGGDDFGLPIGKSSGR